MLSDHERRTLGQIQAELAASDPEFAQFFTASDVTPTVPGLRRTYLIWVIAATAALLTLLSLAIGLASGAFLCATVVLGALVCQLWWPHPGFSHLSKRRNQ